MRNPDELIIVNGVAFPSPDEGYEILHSINVDAGRNTNGAVIGQRVGRPLWKIENLQWSNLDAQSWKEMRQALDPFFVTVTFTTDENERVTIEMYPGDKHAHPSHVEGLSYTKFKTCKFNLIDCGK